MQNGKKFQFPSQDNFTGGVYLQPVAAGTKTHNVKKPMTGESDGTSTVTHKDYLTLRTKSPAPKHLVTKVRKDNNGKLIA
jgi:hypothetical protein